MCSNAANACDAPPQQFRHGGYMNSGSFAAIEGNG